jgi:hypothetical protein
MLPWNVDAVIVVVLVAIAIWARSRPRPRRDLRRLAFVYGVLFVAATLVGVAAGLLVSFDPYAGEFVSPSQRARAAMGISEPVNLAATGVMAFLVPTLTVWVMLLRGRDESAGNPPAQSVTFIRRCKHSGAIWGYGARLLPRSRRVTVMKAGT